MATTLPAASDIAARSSVSSASRSTLDPRYIAHIRESVDPSAAVNTLEELRAIAERATALAQTVWSTQPASDAKEAVKVLKAIRSSLKACLGRAIAEINRSESWKDDGDRDLTTWMSNQTGDARGNAAKDVRLARALDQDLPHTGEALAQGLISEDHAHILSREATKSDDLRERLKDPKLGEAALVTKAKRMNATEFDKEVKRWATRHDPAGADRQWRKDITKEELTIVPFDHGTKISGWLSTSNGALLQEALQANMGRKAKDDTRPFPQRQAEALIGLAHEVLNSGRKKSGSRIRPQLMITLEYETLHAMVEASGSSMPEDATDAYGQPLTPDEWRSTWQPGDDHTIRMDLDYGRLKNVPPALLPDGTPLAPSELARFACDSTLNRVIFGPESVVLDAGRDQRIFSTHQTKAIIARDRHCRYPGCDEPPSRCETHHSLEWLKDKGPTNVDFGILLCWRHHTLIHKEKITIHRKRGTWQFRRADNTIIHPPGTPGTAPPSTSQPELFQPAHPPF